MQRLHRSEISQLAIGYDSNAHCGLLPNTLGVFRKLFPGVALNLFDMRSAEQFQALENRRIDLGFVGLRPTFSVRDLLSECVAHETIMVAVPASAPLAKKSAIKLTDLAPQFFVGMTAETHPGAREWLLETCQKAGFAANILQEVQTELAALKFVADGLGVAMMPEQIARLPHERVVFRPLTPSLRRESSIAWRADNHSKALQDYIQIVKDLSRNARPLAEAA
ncbi:MAG: LysR family substrate-binding domain-containing protein [Chthoniobacter sp.]|nr:LysR family substrate-binding domain-containing protein [Chthoniobacter sp.]